MKKRMFNFPRPRSVLLALALLLFAEQGFAQCNNLIQNPKIDGTIILSTPRQEFVLGGVPSWNEELKTPQLAGSAKAYSQSTVSFYWGTSSTGEAIGQDIPALQAGEKYAFAMMIKKEPDSMELTNADIGIFAGKRTSSAHDREYGGGVIQVQNSVFEDNYVDIMFSEWCWAGICSCPSSPPGEKFQSSITNNNFKGLADDYYCNDYVDVTLNYYQNWYAGNPPPYSCQPGMPPYSSRPTTPSRCHIIDLSPYLDIWIYLGGITCNLSCERKHWQNGMSGNTTSGNTYAEPCATSQPHSQYH